MASQQQFRMLGQDDSSVCGEAASTDTRQLPPGHYIFINRTNNSMVFFLSLLTYLQPHTQFKKSRHIFKHKHNLLYK